MFRQKRAILLLNVGTPANPEISGVRKFLSEFLNDKRVIGIPWFLRKILVSCIIVPFRAPQSSKLYKKLWTGKGSPLLFHGLSLKEKLAHRAGGEFIVEFASNYQQPNIKDITESILKDGVGQIIAFPLYPQYSSSTTGSAFEKLFKILARQNNIPAIKTVHQYYDHPLYLEAMAERISRYEYLDYDHILMSFHGLPLRQVRSSHHGKACEHFNCINEVSERNANCYHAACHATSRLLADKLGIDKRSYSVSFQSRIARKWLSPFTDEVIISLAMEGRKRVLVVCPSFTSDCLETTIEVGQVYRDLFLENGGLDLTLVESLNESESWVDAILGIINDL